MKLVKKINRFLKYISLPVLGTITNVSTLEPVAALTFDDGPDPEYTPLLLNVLKKYNVRGTFFMIGKAAENYPELVQQVAQAGHIIGNHSWDHRSFRSIGRKERVKQILKCAKALSPYGQKLFRPPYGDQSISSRIDAFLLGYKVVIWNVCVYDWLKHDPFWIFDKLINSLKPGIIILLHDSLWDTIEEGVDNRTQMIEALDKFLEKTTKQFKFVSVPELLNYGRVQKIHWYFNSNIKNFTFCREARV